MQKEPLVSICIPHYNNKESIAETLESLLNQTYSNIIIKIFDNASTDGSYEILQRYADKYPNIYLHRNEKNIGGEANFTKCIENLEGEYGALYHADDLYAPEMVEKQVEFFQTHPECSGVATHAYTIDENSHQTGFRQIPKEFLDSEYTIIGHELELFQSVLKNGNYITCPSVMARTDIYKEKIQFWNGQRFKTSADLDVWFRLAQHGKFGFISLPLMSYRESTSSYTYTDIRTRTTDSNMFLVLDYYLNIYSDKLSRVDKNRHAFLHFKDNTNRTINEVIKGIKGDLKLDIFDRGIVSVALESKNNAVIYCIAIVFKILRKTTLPKILREKIFEYRFSKGKN